MNKKSRWFLGLACTAMLVSMGRFIAPAMVDTRVADFAVGLSAALLVGVLVTWKHRRAR